MSVDSAVEIRATGPDATPPPESEHVYVFPVTSAQQRLLFLNQLDPKSTSYNVPWSIRIGGTPNSAALEQSLNEIVRRHEILRTTYDVVEGHPVQIVSPAVGVPLVFDDLSTASNPEQAAQAAALDEAQTPLDLKNGPIVRTRLLRLNDSDHVLLITTHHIAFDGWSRRILVNELATLYEAFCAVRPSPLPELPLQYADYAIWQKNQLQGENLEKLLNYWRKQLAGTPTTLDLPTDRPRPPRQSYSGAITNFTFPAKLKEDLNRLCRQSEATLFMGLLAGFQVLLSRYSGQDDVLVGAPIANRSRAQVEEIIGLFANTLPLRTRLDGDPTFRELLGRVKEVALGAYAHQDMPFERLVEELRPERSLGYNPLFQIVLSLQNAPRPGFELPGLQLKPLGALSNVPAKLDLSFLLFDAPGELQGKVEYNTDLFDRTTVDRMIRHFQVLLEGVVANPEERVSRLPLMTEGEKHTLLVDWNQTSADFPSEACAHELFERAAALYPDNVAVVDQERRLTYGELNQRANQLARYLRGRGVTAETVVALFVDRSLEFVVAMVGVAKAGGAFLPLDPAYPKERLSFMLQDAGVRVLLTQAKHLPELPSFDSVLCLDRDWPEFAKEQAANLPLESKPGNLAYVIYTSGSTGKPKGVEIEHRGLVNLMAYGQRVYKVRPTDRATQVASPAFDASVLETWPILGSGAALHIPDDETRTSPLDLLRWLEQESITLSFLPTPLAEAVLEALTTFDPARLKLRVLLTGGDKLHRRPGPALPFTLFNLYGPTEDSVVTTATAVSATGETTPSIGRPIANHRVYVLDTNLAPVPIGVPGEFCIAGVGLARGYRNRPEVTAERFLLDPFSSRAGDRLYRTGDQVRYLADGNLEFLGRLDQQVKIRGFRIELGEIEAELSRHPAVKQAVVVAREDRPGDTRLVAYIVPNPQQDPSPSDLRVYLEQNLPAYMIPAMFVKIENVLLTPNGKVERRALPAPDWSRVNTSAKTGPGDPTEIMLVRIWERVLRVSNVGIDDNFFDLGGHSLLAVTLLSEIEKVIGRKLPLASLFRGSTVAAQAKLLREGTEVDPEPLVMEYQAGRPGTAAFFAVAAPGVRSLGYILLARNLGETQPFFKLQAQFPMVQGRPLNWGELRWLAQQYVAGMRAIQPEGPYFLVAMCGGCQIAEQMILQLESQGQKVALFAIFDTWVLEHAHRRWGWRLFSYHQRLRWLRKVSLREQMGWAKRAMENRMRVWRGLVKPTRPWAEAYWPEDFKPPRFLAPIVLFKRPRQPYYYIDDPLLGWGARSEGGVETHNINADHHEVLREPHVQFVSRVLLKHIGLGNNHRGETAGAPDPAGQSEASISM